MQRASFLDSDAVAFDKLDVPSCWQFRGCDRPFYVNIRYRFPYKPPVIPTAGKAGRTNKKARIGFECQCGLLVCGTAGGFTLSSAFPAGSPMQPYGR